MTNAPLYFGLVPPEEWSVPQWIQSDRIEQAEKGMRLINLNHGNNLGWRKMARYKEPIVTSRSPRQLDIAPVLLHDIHFCEISSIIGKFSLNPVCFATCPMILLNT